MNLWHSFKFASGRENAKKHISKITTSKYMRLLTSSNVYSKYFDTLSLESHLVSAFQLQHLLYNLEPQCVDLGAYNKLFIRHNLYMRSLYNMVLANIGVGEVSSQFYGFKDVSCQSIII